ncbi:CDP-glycerol glycerophosphotransferase [Shewanella sp. 10N.286.51.B7]|uniref:CDP-glycerol glycerophosphotransferase family protein n=1 Tax=Shewanella electrodiphila TaxID=934143 RepID=A0ABT0KU50_9GAMM|nr:CDP-glycerol glycerophosphotransferase family protein [Shewanella sp. 10N.286.51.B7]MCL1047365.1 CDP-glycerol glycerophosphotransferase family protein [Shewanella electrodiphila]PMG78672.1 CDP-glycerol glycerophosphotransferase [Shewanella sp. 10N.286.51.B7]
MIIFDVLHPYYLPQYLPVAAELEQRAIPVCFVIYKSQEQQHVLDSLVVKHKLDVVWVENESQALEHYLSAKPNWVIFGNAFSQASQLKDVSKTALMQHGVGPKSVYYTVSKSDIDVRFVEGQYRLSRLQEMFPEKIFIDTGYAKLDPIIQGEEKGIELSALGLDPSKATLLYAPTFYPSSIEKMNKDWPEQFSGYNILLKPHYFSLSKPSYKKQKALLEYWQTFSNVYLATAEEANLLPFMASADVLISDASSALFEFAALDKPVVWCDFYHLRWSYRGIFKFRFKNRVDQDLYRYADVAAHAESYSELKAVVDGQVSCPQQFAQKRAQYTDELVGIVDGHCSQRIADYLLKGSQ